MAVKVHLSCDNCDAKSETVAVVVLPSGAINCVRCLPSFHQVEVKQILDLFQAMFHLHDTLSGAAQEALEC